VAAPETSSTSKYFVGTPAERWSARPRLVSVGVRLRFPRTVTGAVHSPPYVGTSPPGVNPAARAVFRPWTLPCGYLAGSANAMYPFGSRGRPQVPAPAGARDGALRRPET